MRSWSVKSSLYRCCPAGVRPLWDRIEASELGYRLVKGTFWALTGAVISRGLMFTAMVLVARILGKEVFGELGIIRSTTAMFAVFAGVGLGVTANKHVAELRRADPRRAGHVIALSGVVAALSGTLMAAVLFFCAPWLASHILHAPHLVGVLHIGCLLLFFGALIGAQTGALAGFEAFRTVAYVNLGVGLMSFPILLLGAYWGGLLGTVWAQVINMSILWTLNHLALRREAIRAAVPLAIVGCFKEGRILWQFSLPAALSGMIVAPVQWFARAMLVNQPGGYGEMGLFGAALTFQQVLLFVGVTLNAPMLSMISNTGTRTNDRLDRVNMASSWLLGIVPALPLLCFPELAGLLFGADYNGIDFARTFCVVILYTCVVLYKQGLARVLVANNLLWWGFASNLFWSVVAVIGAVVMVPWGAVGLATTLLVAYVANTVVFIPVYTIKDLVPRDTILSRQTGLVWSVIIAAAICGFFQLNVLIRVAVLLAGAAAVFNNMKGLVWPARATAPPSNSPVLPPL